MNIWNEEIIIETQVNQITFYLHCELPFFFFLLYPMRSMGESIGIGLEASSTSTDLQAKTTEPMDSTKVTYCRIQLG